MKFQANNTVSVILPTYNRRPLLSAAINSVLDQTYTDIELVIIDDASNDGTKEYLQQLIEECEVPIKLIYNNENKGAGFCRNLGVKNASGRFISFIDSDDLYPANRLKNQVDRLTLEKQSICFGDYLRFKSETVYKKKYLSKMKWTFHSLLGNPCLSIGTLMVDRSRLQNLPAFKENARRGEDYLFNLRLLNQVPFALYIPDCFLLYRQVDNRPPLVHDLFDVYLIFRNDIGLNRFKSALYFIEYLARALLKRFHYFWPFINGTICLENIYRENSRPLKFSAKKS